MRFLNFFKSKKKEDEEKLLDYQREIQEGYGTGYDDLEEEPAVTASWTQTFKSIFLNKTFRSIVFPTVDDSIRYTGNFSRDAMWALSAAKQWDINLMPTPSFWQQTEGQFACSSALALLTQIGAISFCKARGYQVDMKKAVAGFIALSVAIITWNLGQEGCENASHENLDLSDKDAGYLSGLCTGGLEGPPVQFFLYEMLLLLMRHADTMQRYASYFKNGVTGLGRGVGYYLYNIAFAWCAGALWLEVYNGIFPDCTDDPATCTPDTVSNVILVSLAVGWSVMFANHLTTIVNNLNSMLLDKCCPSSRPSETIAANSPVAMEKGDSSENASAATLPYNSL